jgi:hypothetical protein
LWAPLEVLPIGAAAAVILCCDRLPFVLHDRAIINRDDIPKDWPADDEPVTEAEMELIRWLVKSALARLREEAKERKS